MLPRFHLVTREAHDAEFDAYPQPEILRTSLEDLVLQILVLDLGDPKVFLNKAVSPPTAAAVDRAIELLAGIDALEPLEETKGVPKVATLTALGFHLAALPVEPRVGKLLLAATKTTPSEARSVRFSGPRSRDVWEFLFLRSVRRRPRVERITNIFVFDTGSSSARCSARAAPR